VLPSSAERDHGLPKAGLQPRSLQRDRSASITPGEATAVPGLVSCKRHHHGPNGDHLTQSLTPRQRST
jgi:hypothetical protein